VWGHPRKGNGRRKTSALGGFVEGWTPTDEVHDYDPASDRWQRLAKAASRGLRAIVLQMHPLTLL